MDDSSSLQKFDDLWKMCFEDRAGVALFTSELNVLAEGRQPSAGSEITIM
jgi:hypothetical protein